MPLRISVRSAAVAWRSVWKRPCGRITAEVKPPQSRPTSRATSALIASSASSGATAGSVRHSSWCDGGGYAPREVERAMRQTWPSTPNSSSTLIVVAPSEMSCFTPRWSQVVAL
jgi:hypothetical protein